MKTLGRLSLIILLLFSPVFANLHWNSIESSRYIIYFPRDLQTKAEIVLASLKASEKTLFSYIGKRTTFKIPVVLEDHGLSFNSLAYPESGKINLWVRPITPDGSIRQYENWLHLVSLHEALHIAHLSQAEQSAELAVNVFGRLFAPNLYTPGWFKEGLAVIAESDLSPYEGRLHDDYASTLIQKQVAAGMAPDLGWLTLPFFKFPYGNAIYAYGGEFLAYLENRYSKEKIAKFNLENSKNLAAPLSVFLPSSGFDRTAKTVFGESFLKLYSQWLAELKKTAISYPSTSVTHSGGFKKSLLTGNNQLIFAHSAILNSFPLQAQRLDSIKSLDPETGHVQVITELTSPVSGPMQYHRQKLYFLQETIDYGFANISNFGFGASRALKSFDMKSQRSTVIHQGQILAFSVQDSGQIIFATASSKRDGSTLWKIADGETSALGHVPDTISEMLPTSETEFIVVAKSQFGAWQVKKLDINSLSLRAISQSRAASAHISKHGNDLIYWQNKNAKSHIVKYDTLKNLTSDFTPNEFVSSPVFLNNSLFFIGLEAQGYEIKRSDKSHFKPAKSLSHSPVKIFDLQETPSISKVTPISQLETLFPFSRFFPFQARGEDHLGYLSYSLAFSSIHGSDALLHSRHLAPISLSVLLRSRTKPSLLINAPIYRSLLGGLASINFSFETSSLNNNIGFNVLVNSPRSSAFFSHKEKLNGSGYHSIIRTRWADEKGGIKATIQRLKTYEYTQRFRGNYFVSSKIQDGLLSSFEYSLKIADIQRGMWEPTISVGALFLNVFADASDLTQYPVSYGLEAISELGLFHNIKSNLGLGIAFRDISPQVFIRFELSI